MSESFSSVICESCNSKLSEFCDFRSEICEYQTKLYTCASDNPVTIFDQPLPDSPIKEDTINQEENDPDEMEMKVESIEEDDILIYEEEPIDTKICTYKEQFIILNDREMRKDKQKGEKFCSLCNRNFPIKSYYQHKMRHHAVGAELICDVDGKSFRLKNDLREHMKIHVHLDTRPRFYCKTCHNPFLSMSALKNHENYFHSEYIQEHPCEQCYKIFSSRMKLQQHTKNCHLNASFVCPQCNNIYATPASLKKHIKKKHESKQPCTVCEKLFPQSSMSQHMASHIAPQFKCNFENCNREFHRKSSLKSHMQSHENLEPIHCPECNASFPTIRHLYRHKKRQHNSSRAQCEVVHCFHTTTRKDYLVKHYQCHRELDEATRQILIDRVKDLKDIAW